MGCTTAADIKKLLSEICSLVLVVFFVWWLLFCFCSFFNFFLVNDITDKPEAVKNYLLSVYTVTF